MRKGVLVIIQTNPSQRGLSSTPHLGPDQLGNSQRRPSECSQRDEGMRVTVFSSNQPRHLNLARGLAKFTDTVYFVSEVNTVFPGKVSGFFQKTEVMQDYFSNVIQSEKKIFGDFGLGLNDILL